jgi:hypothetical protein
MINALVPTKELMKGFPGADKPTKPPLPSLSAAKRGVRKPCKCVTG